MKYITFNQNGGGRSGHHLKEILTAYVFSFFLKDIQVVSHPSWFNQLILNNFPDVNQYKELIDNKTSIVNIHHKKLEWDGMSFDQFSDYLSQINSCPDNSLIELSGICRVLPYQLSDWYNCDLIKSDIFLENFVPTIRRLYRQDFFSNPINQLSIHARRGDLAGENINNGFSVDFYSQFISWFLEYFPDTPIKIFSESINCKDLVNAFSSHPDVQLCLGDSSTLKRDIAEMVVSKYFLPSHSSLSTNISYISTNTTFIPFQKNIKHFQKNCHW